MIGTRERMSAFHRKFRVETIRKLKQDVQELVKEAYELFDKVKEHEKEKKSRHNASQSQFACSSRAAASVRLIFVASIISNLIGWSDAIIYFLSSFVTGEECDTSSQQNVLRSSRYSSPRAPRQRNHVSIPPLR